VTAVTDAAGGYPYFVVCEGHSADSRGEWYSQVTGITAYLHPAGDRPSHPI
jgi:hypothetical protein